jgi:hypothetical protein
MQARIATVVTVVAVGGVLLPLAPATAGPGLTLPEGGVNATVTLELDASSDRFADTASVAPDLAAGVTEHLTLALIHSTFGRTGFRGVAGAGICATDTCADTYDNAGLEALYSLRRGALAIAANGGVHATSFERDFYVAKLGAKLRYGAGRATLAALPSVTVALTERDAMAPNRDRLWLPVSATFAIAHGLSLGASTGLKGPLDDTFGDGFEIAAGVLATYTHSPRLTLGASWVHGKLLGGDVAVPEAMDGVDSRAVQVWVSASL